MRIAVIAASGRLGKIFVEQALRAGHSIKAGVRGDHTLAAHPNLTIVNCDATNRQELIELCKDQEVVVSAIGHVKGSSPDVQTVATKLIVSVMSELHINRFVDVTGTGVRFTGDKITIMDRILNASIQIIDPNRVRDGILHEEVLKNSDLKWTTIRVLKLQNVSPKPYQLKPHGPTKLYVSRQEVALAMLEVIEQNSFIAQAPIIAKL